MAKKLGATCPCGFSFKTPHGADDAVAVLQLHVNRNHKKDMPKGAPYETCMTMIKEVE